MLSHFPANTSSDCDRLARFRQGDVWSLVRIALDGGIGREAILSLSVQFWAELRWQQLPQRSYNVRLGKRSRFENQQRFDVLLDALLAVKAYRVGRTIRAQLERVSRIQQVIIRLDE